MPRLTSIASLLKDSPPVWVFELSEAGVAAAISSCAASGFNAWRVGEVVEIGAGGARYSET